MGRRLHFGSTFRSFEVAPRLKMLPVTAIYIQMAQLVLSGDSSSDSSGPFLSPAACVGIAIVLGALRHGFSRSAALAHRAWRSAGCATSRPCAGGSWLVLPLVFLAILATSQFQKAANPQDAIRQTTNACLFASGLVVVLLIIMTACTNLPREIENRVIYTVTTKPVTRLEIVLGKMAGFSLLSLLLLSVMGIATYGYLLWLDSQARAKLSWQIQNEKYENMGPSTAKYLQEKGLLLAREFANPGALYFLASEPPIPATTGRRETIPRPRDRCSPLHISAESARVNAGDGPPVLLIKP